MNTPLSLWPWHLVLPWTPPEAVTPHHPGQPIPRSNHLSVQKSLPMSNLFSSQRISFSWCNTLSAILHTTQASSLTKPWLSQPCARSSLPPQPIMFHIPFPLHPWKLFKNQFSPYQLSSKLTVKPGPSRAAVWCCLQHMAGRKRGWEALIKWHFSFCFRSIMSG